MKSKLIIDADDYGWSRENVDSIITLYKKGIVSSTSVMTTMPAFEYGVEKLKENSGLGAGVHLSLFDGKPVLPVRSVPSLVDGNTGIFLSYEVLEKRKNRIDVYEAAAEFAAQIDKFLSTGLRPTHFDVHTSLPYMIPKLYREILKLNDRYGLPMRTLIGADFKKKSRELAARQKLPPFIIRMAGHRLLKTAGRFGIRHPDYFIPEFSNGDNQAPVGDKVEQLGRIFDNLQPGISELLTHPSLADDLWRQIEHEAWVRFGDALKSYKNRVELCDYRALSRKG